MDQPGTWCRATRVNRTSSHPLSRPTTEDNIDLEDVEYTPD